MFVGEGIFRLRRAIFGGMSSVCSSRVTRLDRYDLAGLIPIRQPPSVGARHGAGGYTEIRHWRNRQICNGCHAARPLPVAGNRAGGGYWSRGFVSGITPFGLRPDLARVVGGRRGNLGCDEFSSVSILNLVGRRGACDGCGGHLTDGHRKSFLRKNSGTVPH